MDTPHVSTLHRFLRSAGFLICVLALLAASAGRADAGRTWCQRDPVIKLDGRVAAISLGGPAELDETALGAAEIVVHVPVGTTVELLATDNGFNKQGYAVSFVEDGSLSWETPGTTLAIRASVPAPDPDLALEIVFSPRSLRVEGGSAIGSVSGVWLRV
jgi:hypothetical protein